MTSLQPPLSARNGRVLEVLAICRISTAHQDERSLADQEASYRVWLDRHTDLPYELTVIASQGSGECLDREAYLEAVAAAESGKYDLIVCEDLGRICRRVHAHIFCENCLDHDTRLIAINDHVDTGREDWHLGSFFAVMRHESYNRDTAARIKRSLRNRFANGGVIQFTIFGYVKPEGAKSDEELKKDPDAEPIYEEWFRRLEAGVSYSEIADWLNEQCVKPGKYCRSNTWTCAMVARVTHNPILKGLRVRNKKLAKRVNKTGRRKSVNAPPEELLTRECPHLAFVDPARYDRIIGMVKERNGKYRRRGKDGRDQRAGVPKKRSRWPGQHLRCGICRRLFVWGGHGQNHHLVCDGARQYRCWQAITVDGPLAVRKITPAISDELERLPGFDEQLLADLRAEHAQLHAKDERELDAVEREIRKRDTELSNLLEFIRGGKTSAAVRQELERVESDIHALNHKRDELISRPSEAPQLPSMDEIKRLAREALACEADDPWELARVMKRLIPRIAILPYRLCDGGHPEVRAHAQPDAAHS